MIEVIIARLGIEAGTNSYVVVLQEKHGARLLPIWIGRAEAESIVHHMQGEEASRPMTHDLCRNIIVATGMTLRSAHITHVANKTYHGELHLADHAGAPVLVDSRPSDAIAIAIRCDAPIYAADDLLEDPGEESSEESTDESTFTVPESSTPEPDLSADKLKQYLEHLRPEDFGKFSL